jgi:hypothetical protein
MNAITAEVSNWDDVRVRLTAAAGAGAPFA